MRASPPVDVALTRFGVWHAVMALVGAASVASTLAWWLAHETPTAAAVMVPCALAVCAAVALAASLMRSPPLRLRWDGSAWHVGGIGPHAAPAVAGEVAVVADFGAWMLLRFSPTAGQARAVARWVPLQRAGLEGPWHALRCAVYSPRPLPGDEPAPP